MCKLFCTKSETDPIEQDNDLADEHTGEYHNVFEKLFYL